MLYLKAKGYEFRSEEQCNHIGFTGSLEHLSLIVGLINHGAKQFNWQFFTQGNLFYLTKHTVVSRHDSRNLKHHKKNKSRAIGFSAEKKRDKLLSIYWRVIVVGPVGRKKNVAFRGP